MTTKVPFTSRCGVLSAIFLLIAVIISSKLIALQIVDADGHSGIAADELIAKERIPAQRGIIMDRNEEILTSNILSAEVVADRYHLREITAVVDGLAYNHACHDPKWDEEPDETSRRKLVHKYRADLMEKVTSSITPEEKAKMRRNIDMTDAKANRLLEYDQKVCEYLYQQHDQLVAELLYPYLSKVEIVENAPDEAPVQPQPQPKQKGKKGKKAKAVAQAPAAPRKRTRFMTKEDIVRLIAQPDVAEHNRTAEAEGKPTRSYRNQIILAKGLTLEDADKIKEAVRAAHVRGIMVQSDLRRTYTMPRILCHVLGYVNFENKGQGGVEDVFNSYLAGTDGMREYRRNARGQVLPNEDDRYLAPKHGLNIKLTIDTRIQNILEEELDKGLQFFHSKRGCMIAVDPKTGDILAMVSRPAFDINTKDIIMPDGVHARGTVFENGTPVTGDFNYACQGRYEPGSTMKVVAVTTAVDTGALRIDSVINCTPYHVPGGKAINDGNHPYSALTVGDVLKKSSNPGAARIALLHCKWPNYKTYLERYGLHKSVGIPLPSGGPCIISDGTKLINFSRIAYGYSLSVSPLHMAMVYATIANDGVRMRPRLIDKIIAPDGSVYDECAPEKVETVMSPETAKKIRRALHSVTDKPGSPGGQGTASAAAIPGFKIGGKTGTAKKVTGKGSYHEGLYTVSFAGVLPIDNPRMVILTVVDEPHPTNCNAGGGTVAAPIFRAAAERIIDLLNIEPSDPEAYAKYKEEKRKGQGQNN